MSAITHQCWPWKIRKISTCHHREFQLPQNINYLTPYYTVLHYARFIFWFRPIPRSLTSGPPRPYDKHSPPVPSGRRVHALCLGTSFTPPFPVYIPVPHTSGFWDTPLARIPQSPNHALPYGKRKTLLIYFFQDISWTVSRVRGPLDDTSITTVPTLLSVASYLKSRDLTARVKDWR